MAKIILLSDEVHAHLLPVGSEGRNYDGPWPEAVLEHFTDNDRLEGYMVGGVFMRPLYQMFINAEPVNKLHTKDMVENIEALLDGDPFRRAIGKRSWYQLAGYEAITEYDTGRLAG